jgi:hypothetical protein
MAPLSLMLSRWDYYTTPLSLRPFRQDYATMKPSGTYSHGLGIVGSLFIISGVAIYSTRKRVRVFRNVGKLSWWLEFHIFLCLVGPILVTYHTTFKAGGIAAISLWTMLSVVASGIVGRFLYVLIPRNVAGDQITIEELNSNLSGLGTTLRQSFIGVKLITMLDEGFDTITKPKGILDTFQTIVRLQQLKRTLSQRVNDILKSAYVATEETLQLKQIANDRASLMQKSIVLQQVERLFFYWHAVHLPFTIIMFITLAAHVTVTVLLGYTWIF